MTNINELFSDKKEAKYQKNLDKKMKYNLAI